MSGDGPLTRAEVRQAADNILDRPSADPDDDAAILARFAVRYLDGPAPALDLEARVSPAMGSTDRAPRPVPHSEPASAVGPSADRRDEDAGPGEASEVQAGRLPPVPVADIPPGGGLPDPDREAHDMHIREEHDATHGEAEQCGAECIALGLADFDDEPDEGDANREVARR